MLFSDTNNTRYVAYDLDQVQDSVITLSMAADDIKFITNVLVPGCCFPRLAAAAYCSWIKTIPG